MVVGWGWGGDTDGGGIAAVFVGGIETKIKRIFGKQNFVKKPIAGGIAVSDGKNPGAAKLNSAVRRSVTKNSNSIFADGGGDRNLGSVLIVDSRNRGGEK